MLDLKGRLLVVEDEFHCALSQGETAVHTFNIRWETLLQDINTALDSPLGLDPETSTLAHATAVRLAELADISFHLFSSYNNITTQLVGELDCLMSELTITDSGPCPTSSRPPALPLGAGSCSTDTSCRKRRRSRDEQSDESTSRKSGKRPCVAYGDSLSEPICRRPSSAERTCLPTQSSTSAVAFTNRKRKRRLSDADACPPKPSKLLYKGPRLHAVSDSFLAVRMLPSDCAVYEGEDPSLWDTQAPDVAGSAIWDIQPGSSTQFDVCPALESLSEDLFSPTLILNTPLLTLPNPSLHSLPARPDPSTAESPHFHALPSLESGSNATVSPLVVDAINFEDAHSYMDDGLQDTWSMLTPMFDDDCFPSFLEGYPSMQPIHPTPARHISDGDSDVHWAPLFRSQPATESYMSLQSDSCGSESSSDSEDECPTPRSQVAYQPFQCKEDIPAIFTTLEDADCLHSK